MSVPEPEKFAAGGPATEVENEAQRLALQAVAAASQDRPDLAMAHTLAPEIRPLVYTLIRSLADNKLMLARRYAEWCTGSPQLESSVAAASMTQDELGHARSFYPLLRGFPEGSAEQARAMEERGWQTHPTSAIAGMDATFDSWSGFVAANFLVDSAFTTFFEAAIGSPYEPLGQRARKIVQEEQPHWIHAEGWLRRLADSGNRALLERNLHDLWPHAATWFGLPDDAVLAGLQRGGIIAAGPGDLRERLRERLTPALQSAGLQDVLQDDLPWPRWNPAARRLAVEPHGQRITEY